MPPNIQSKRRDFDCPFVVLLVPPLKNYFSCGCDPRWARLADVPLVRLVPQCRLATRQGAAFFGAAVNDRRYSPEERTNARLSQVKYRKMR
jgi:hypothetical protein